MIQLDTTDKAILKRLLQNARVSYVQLGKELNISNTMIHKRINKLKQSGFLRNATFTVDITALGYTTEAYTRVKVSSPMVIKAVIKKLKSIPEIVSCSNITGEYALIMRIYARNNHELRDILYKEIHPIEGIVSTDTIISFETAFEKNNQFVIE